MPNHISNRLSLKGSKEDIARIFSEIGNDESPIDFGKIIPEPEGLIKGNLSLERLKETAGFNWYDWRIQNYGTKWPAYDQVRLSPKAIYFETAWEAPFPIFDRLAEKYDSVEIKVEYADEDRGTNAGILLYKDGELVEDQELSGKEASALLTKLRRVRNSKTKKEALDVKNS